VIAEEFHRLSIQRVQLDREARQAWRESLPSEWNFFHPIAELLDGSFTPFHLVTRGLGTMHLQDLFNWKYKKFALSNLLDVDALGFIFTVMCGYSGNTSDSEIFKLSEAYRTTEGVQGANIGGFEPACLLCGSR
jgi:hypothetical protein